MRQHGSNVVHTCCPWLVIKRASCCRTGAQGLVQDEWQDKTHLRFTLRSVCAPLPTVLCKDAKQMHAAVHAGGDENVRQLCALRVRCSGSCAKRCARELRKLVRRQARGVRTEVVRLGHECTRLSFERGALCCAPIYQD